MDARTVFLILVAALAYSILTSPTFWRGVISFLQVTWIGLMGLLLIACLAAGGITGEEILPILGAIFGWKLLAAAKPKEE